MLQHDTVMREKTFNIINKITNRTERIRDALPSTGNVALLECFSQGYIFAPNTIQDCFQLTYSRFGLLYESNMHHIHAALGQLNHYVDYFRNIFEKPLVNFTVRSEFLEADTVLYDLQRCIYKSSATIYSVTTPTSEHTSPNTSPVIPTVYPVTSSYTHNVNISFYK